MNERPSGDDRRVARRALINDKSAATVITVPNSPLTTLETCGVTKNASISRTARHNATGQSETVGLNDSLMLPNVRDDSPLQAVESILLFCLGFLDELKDHSPQIIM